MTTQSSQVILINGFGVLFVVLNTFGLGLRLPVTPMVAPPPTPALGVPLLTKGAS